MLSSIVKGKNVPIIDVVSVKVYFNLPEITIFVHAIPIQT